MQLLERDTAKRLGVNGNIKIHPFFKTINWTLLEKRAVEPPFKPKVVRAPTPMGAARLLLASTAFRALPLLLHLHAFLISILPASLLPWPPGTFCLCLYLCVLTTTPTSVRQSVSEQRVGTVDLGALQ